MRIISHRGNLNGPIQEKENTEQYLIDALDEGFDLEFDLWYVASEFWLGHDAPTFSYSIDTLIQWSNRYNNQKFYTHCKNIWAIEQMIKVEKNNIIPFFHDVDQCILLKDKTIWVHPYALGSVAEKKSCIAVLSTCKTSKYDINYDVDFSKFYGICTDYPITVRNTL